MIMMVFYSTYSPVTNSEFNASDFLGGISTDEKTGEIKAAKAAIFTYFMKGTNSTDGEENEDDLAEEDTVRVVFTLVSCYLL